MKESDSRSREQRQLQLEWLRFLRNREREILDFKVRNGMDSDEAHRQIRAANRGMRAKGMLDIRQFYRKYNRNLFHNRALHAATEVVVLAIGTAFGYLFNHILFDVILDIDGFPLSIAIITLTGSLATAVLFKHVVPPV